MIYKLFSEIYLPCRDSKARSNATGSGPVPLGVREFKSLSLHIQFATTSMLPGRENDDCDFPVDSCDWLVLPWLLLSVPLVVESKDIKKCLRPIFFCSRIFCRTLYGLLYLARLAKLRVSQLLCLLSVAALSYISFSKHR